MAPGDAEARYRAGAACWTRRELTEAVELLRQAEQLSDQDPEDTWGPAIDRALAQILLELDRPEEADAHLPGDAVDPVSLAQTLAIRAKVGLARGDEAAAALAANACVQLLADVPDLDDIGWRMNGAIALALVADALVELGLPDDALDALAGLRSRVDAAGVHDPAVEAMAAQAEAGAHRLLGDARRARAAAARIDVTLDADLPVLVERLEARLAWDAGDRGAAAAAYARARAACDGQQLVLLERTLRAEEAAGPPVRRDERLADLARVATEDLLAAAVPYALVLTLQTGPSDATVALEDAVADLLAASPHLGSIDGTGTDGEIWELFLEGDDPAALWEAVRPLVAATDPPAGGEVRLRDGDVTRTIPI